jgi:hypothetical protein
MTNSSPAPATDLSAGLRELLRTRKARLNLGDIVRRFESHGGLAEVLFVLTLPVLLPLPPGASMVLALPLLVVAPQIVAGRKKLWLPHWLADRTLERKSFARVIHRVMGPLRRVEAMGRPRLCFMTGPLGARLVGVAATVIALVLVLPIPFANLLPSVALSLFALGLRQRDGLMVLGGYSLSGVAIGVIVLGAHAIRLLFHHLMAMI